MEEYRRIYRCAVMGQHPMRLPWGFDEEDDRCQKLKMELAQQIMALHQRGVSQFLTACDCGVGLYAAEIVNGLRETADPDMMLFCYTPHEEQATKWAPYLRERYFTSWKNAPIFRSCVPWVRRMHSCKPIGRSSTLPMWYYMSMMRICQQRAVGKTEPLLLLWKAIRPRWSCIRKN